MKTSKDPRHIYRKKMIKGLFAGSFAKHGNISPELSKIFEGMSKIDAEIEKAAPTWPIEKINKIDLAILRFAIFEMNENITPQKVIIDEAVEIAKEYGSENSPSFVNGVLGTIYENRNTKGETNDN